MNFAKSDWNYCDGVLIGILLIMLRDNMSQKSCVSEN